MKTLNAVTATSAAALLLMVSTIQAQPPGPRGPMRGPGGFDRPTTAVVEMMAKRLDLTDQQRTRITDILDQTREAVKGPSQELRGIMENTRTSIMNELTDEQKQKVAEGKQDLFQALGGFAMAHRPEMRDRAEAAGEEIRLRLALGSLELQPEQREKLQEIAKEVREKQAAIREELKPKMESMKTELEQKLKDVLTSEQQTELEQKLKEGPRFGEGPRAFGPAAKRMRGLGGGKGAGECPAKADKE